MRLSQDRLVLAATVVSESAWVYALLGVLGAASGRDEGPLDWFGVVAILGLSTVLGRLAPSNTRAIEFLYLASALIGSAVVYLVVGTQVEMGTVDLAWGLKLLNGVATGDYLFKAIAGAFFGVLLWWRGVRLAGVEFPTESLSFSFRIGILALTVATIVDIYYPAQLNTFPMIFVFFAGALGGLSIGHILPETRKSAEARTWPRVVSGVVASVLVVGVVFGLLHRGMLSFLATPGRAALDAAWKGFFWGVVAPIAYVFDLITGGIIAFFDRVFEPDAEEAGGDLGRQAQQALEQLQQQEEEAAGSLVGVIQIIEWVLLAIVVLCFLLLLTKAFRSLLKGRPEATVGHRESVKEDAKPASDIARLLLNLIPDTLRRGGRKRFKLPDGPPGVVNVLRLYYEILNLAEEKGFRRRPQQTANEFQPTLEGVFPRNLARAATEAFNRACYGDHPTAEGEIAQMRSSVDAIKTAVRTISGRSQGFRITRPRS